MNCARRCRTPPAPAGHADRRSDHIADAPPRLAHEHGGRNGAEREPEIARGSPGASPAPCRGELCPTRPPRDTTMAGLEPPSAMAAASTTALRLARASLRRGECIRGIRNAEGAGIVASFEIPASERPASRVRRRTRPIAGSRGSRLSAPVGEKLIEIALGARRREFRNRPRRSAPGRSGSDRPSSGLGRRRRERHWSASTKAVTPLARIILARSPARPSDTSMAALACSRSASASAWRGCGWR